MFFIGVQNDIQRKPIQMAAMALPQDKVAEVSVPGVSLPEAFEQEGEGGKGQEIRGVDKRNSGRT